MKYEVPKKSVETTLKEIRSALIKGNSHEALKIIEWYYSDLFAQEQVDAALKQFEAESKENGSGDV